MDVLQRRRLTVGRGGIIDGFDRRHTAALERVTTHGQMWRPLDELDRQRQMGSLENLLESRSIARLERSHATGGLEGRATGRLKKGGATSGLERQQDILPTRGRHKQQKQASKWHSDFFSEISSKQDISTVPEQEVQIMELPSLPEKFMTPPDNTRSSSTHVMVATLASECLARVPYPGREGDSYQSAHSGYVDCDIAGEQQSGSITKVENVNEDASIETDIPFGSKIEQFENVTTNKTEGVDIAANTEAVEGFSATSKTAEFDTDAKTAEVDTEIVEGNTDANTEIVEVDTDTITALIAIYAETAEVETETADIDTDANTEIAEVVTEIQVHTDANTEIAEVVTEIQVHTDANTEIADIGTDKAEGDSEIEVRTDANTEIADIGTEKAESDSEIEVHTDANTEIVEVGIEMEEVNTRADTKREVGTDTNTEIVGIYTDANIEIEVNTAANTELADVNTAANTESAPIDDLAIQMELSYHVRNKVDFYQCVRSSLPGHIKFTLIGNIQKYNCKIQPNKKLAKGTIHFLDTDSKKNAMLHMKMNPSHYMRVYDTDMEECSVSSDCGVEADRSNGNNDKTGKSNIAGRAIIHLSILLFGLQYYNPKFHTITIH